MKTFVYTLLLLPVLGCSNNSASDQSNSSTNNYNSTNEVTQTRDRSTSEALNNETNVDDDATTFLKMAATSSVLEIELGKIAQQKAMNSRVKNFGAMMVKDHTNALNELKSLAANKNLLVNYTLKPEQKKHIEHMQTLKGADFDKHYMQMMTSAHSKDVDLFNSGADNRDKAVNSFANKTLPILKMHKDSAKAIQISIK